MGVRTLVIRVAVVMRMMMAIRSMIVPTALTWRMCKIMHIFRMKDAHLY